MRCKRLALGGGREGCLRLRLLLFAVVLSCVVYTERTTVRYLAVPSFVTGASTIHARVPGSPAVQKGRLGGEVGYPQAASGRNV